MREPNQMAKRAQGMSMQTIVIAALALLVLVVLVIIFINKSDAFSSNIDNCPSKFKDAECVPDISQCGALRFGTFGCEEGYFCCKPAGVE